MNGMTQIAMTPDEHRFRHVELHAALDELVADFITHRNRMPSKSTILELMEWSHQQTRTPTEESEPWEEDAELEPEE